MKILLASDSYRFTTSGVTSVVTALEDGLRRMGHEVRVLALANGRTSFREEHRYFIRSYPVSSQPVIRVSFSMHDPLLDELIQWKPDLIHLHTEATVAWMVRKIAAEAHAPVVMTAHTDYAYYVFRRFHTAWPVRTLMKGLGKIVYRNTAAVIAPSEKVRSFAQVQTILDRVMLVPNGIKLEQYQRPVSTEEKAALFQRYGLQDNGCTLVMVTRVSHEKNILEILRFLPALCREIPQAQLIIVGDGKERRRLERYCRKNGLQDRVVFTGLIPFTEVYRYYAMGDVFVSASVFEVHSMSYLEAMSCGLPLVCREDASLRGVLEDGENGFIYRTEREFVQGVARILRDQALRQKMRGQALERIRAFSDQRFVENTIRAYESVLRRQEKTDAGTKRRRSP